MEVPTDWEQILNDLAALEAENLQLRTLLEARRMEPAEATA